MGNDGVRRSLILPRDIKTQKTVYGDSLQKSVIRSKLSPIHIFRNIYPLRSSGNLSGLLPLRNFYSETLLSLR